MYLLKRSILFLLLNVIIIEQITCKRVINIPGLVISIIKPTSRSKFQPAKDETCITECIATHNLKSPEEEHWFYEDKFNITRLHEFCGELEPVQLCVISCLDGDNKVAFGKFYDLSLYMCNQSDYLKHVSCYKTVYIDTKDTCESKNKCGPVYLQLKEAASAASNMTQFQLLKCSYYDCYLDCMRVRMVQKCNEECFKILKTYEQKKFGVINDLIKLEFPKLSEPEICTRFRNEDI